LQHQVANLSSRAQQSPQFDDCLLILLLHHLKPPYSLLLVDGQLNPIISRPKDQITNPQARILEVQAPLRLLSELGKHLLHNKHLVGLNGQAPKHGLSI
jgi:hypothetical protein